MKNKRKKIIIILVVFLVMAMLGFFALQKLRGHGYFSAAKNYLLYILDKPDFSKYEPFKEKEGAWYQENKLIAHAMAGIDDMDYTNSLEAFRNALANGYKVYEVDFVVTADERVVCGHDFAAFGERIPTYEHYMNTQIADRYTPLDMEQMIALLAENPQIYLMTDFKWDNSFGSDNHEVDIIMKELIECVNRYQDESQCVDLYDRIIIQVYSEDNYHAMKEYGVFSNYVYTLYQYAYPIYDEIAAFCLENDIRVVTMGKERATKEHVEILKQWNIKVFSHTVNEPKEAQAQLQNGVTGIYTDWILPVEMESIND